MKKLGFILAVLVILTFAACASSGGSGGGSAAEPFVVDLSTLDRVRNERPFTKNFDDLLIPLPRFDVDVTQYSRITIRAKYFDQNGVEIMQQDSVAMVTLILDLDDDIRGPANGPGPNTPVKEFNVGGFSGTIHLNRGVRINLKHSPDAILFQNNDASTGFIELTTLVFHNGNFSTRQP